MTSDDIIHGVEPSEQNIAALFDDFEKADALSVSARIFEARKAEAITFICQALKTSGKLLNEVSFLDALRDLRWTFGDWFRSESQQAKFLKSRWAKWATRHE